MGVAPGDTAAGSGPLLSPMYVTTPVAASNAVTPKPFTTASPSSRRSHSRSIAPPVLDATGLPSALRCCHTRMSAAPPIACAFAGYSLPNRPGVPSSEPRSPRSTRSQSSSESGFHPGAGPLRRGAGGRVMGSSSTSYRPGRAYRLARPAARGQAAAIPGRAASRRPAAGPRRAAGRPRAAPSPGCWVRQRPAGPGLQGLGPRTPRSRILPRGFCGHGLWRHSAGGHRGGGRCRRPGILVRPLPYVERRLDPVHRPVIRLLVLGWLPGRRAGLRSGCGRRRIRRGPQVQRWLTSGRQPRVRDGPVTGLCSGLGRPHHPLALAEHRPGPQPGIVPGPVSRSRPGIARGPVIRSRFSLRREPVLRPSPVAAGAPTPRRSSRPSQQPPARARGPVIRAVSCRAVLRPGRASPGARALARSPVPRRVGPGPDRPPPAWVRHPRAVRRRASQSSGSDTGRGPGSVHVPSLGSSPWATSRRAGCPGPGAGQAPAGCPAAGG